MSPSKNNIPTEKCDIPSDIVCVSEYHSNERKLYFKVSL